MDNQLLTRPEYLAKNRNQVNGDVLGVAVVEICA